MKPLIRQTLAIALLAGSTLSAVPAIAQNEAPMQGQGGAGSTAPVLPREGSSGGQGSSGAATPGANQAQPSPDMGGAAQQQPDAGAGNGSTNARRENTDPRLKRQDDSAAQEKPADSMNAESPDAKKPRSDDSAQQEPEAQSDRSTAASDRPSDETIGSINVSTEQQTEIRNVFVENRTEPVDVDVDLSVGVAVPTTVELHPLPPRIVEIVPAYRDYEYFVLADGRIIIVQPSTHEVVYILAG